MKLVIFDVDGTLTKTDAVDDLSIVKAFFDSHKIADIDTDWKNYKYVTDSGITLEIFTERLGRAPNEQDIAVFKSCFIKNLSDFTVKDKSLFAEILNAGLMLKNLKAEKDWAIALATGCYYDSAKLKLEQANIDIEDYPNATAEDGVSREEILQIAIEKSLKHYGQREFEKIVSIGDGVWDVRTAKNLALDFIGIAGGKRAERLRKEGAELIIEDFRDYELFVEYLNRGRECFHC